MSRARIFVIFNVGALALAVATMLLGFRFAKPIETQETIDLDGSLAAVELESTLATISAKVRFKKVAPPLDVPCDRLAHSLAVLVEDAAGNAYRFSGGGPKYRVPPGNNASDIDLTRSRGYRFRTLKSNFVFRPRAMYLLVYEKAEGPLTLDQCVSWRRVASAEAHLAACEGWPRVRGYVQPEVLPDDVIDVTLVEYVGGARTSVALRGDGRVRVSWKGRPGTEPEQVQYTANGPEKELLLDTFHVAARDGLLDAEDVEGRQYGQGLEVRYELVIGGQRNRFRTLNISPDRTTSLQKILRYFLVVAWRRQAGEPPLSRTLESIRESR